MRFAEDSGTAGRLLEALRKLEPGPTRIMEICGTHTHAIAECGLKHVLPAGVELISGPGCPVCVTPAGVMDEILRIAMLPDVIVCSYGDLLRVPGSRPGDSLLRRRALGAQVRMVYSPMEALDIAANAPDRRVVFLGVGFETTAPGTAATVLEARRRDLRNFFLLCELRQTEPAIRALASRPDFQIDAFLCPGHVAAITGSEAFRFIPEELGLPAVVSGFEPADLLASVVMILRRREPFLANEYTRAVKPGGNPAALALMAEVLEPCDAFWRGLGQIPGSGYRLGPAFTRWDASAEFAYRPDAGAEPPGCRCGDVICGRLHPEDCPLFGRRCLPEDPVGPCMVSSEGACAAAYRYGEVI